MKRCNQCRRFAVGAPAYCPHCGRTYNVRICARGHLNARDVAFCSQCGSADFSTPAPPESLGVRASRYALWLCLWAGGLALAVGLCLALVQEIASGALLGPLLLLVFWTLLFQWLNASIPAPVKKIGRAVGKRVVKAVTRQHERH